MTIRVVCKSCGSKLDAKDELRGQRRLCPKCKNPVLIEPEPAQTPPVPEPAPTSVPEVSTPNAEPDGAVRMLRLHPDNLYVVLGSDKEIAYWKNREGWFLNLGNGYQLAKRVPDRVPDIGSYVLVEGYVESQEGGRRLKGLRFKALTGRGVLQALVRNETEILEKAKLPAVLTQAQKRFMLEHIRKHYFFEFTEDAPEIIEYLTGFDAHASSVGTFVD